MYLGIVSRWRVKDSNGITSILLERNSEKESDQDVGNEELLGCFRSAAVEEVVEIDMIYKYAEDDDDGAEIEIFI